jgi:hypothetical protein
MRNPGVNLKTLLGDTKYRNSVHWWLPGRLYRSNSMSTYLLHGGILLWIKCNEAEKNNHIYPHRLVL